MYTDFLRYMLASLRNTRNRLWSSCRNSLTVCFLPSWRGEGLQQLTSRWPGMVMVSPCWGQSAAVPRLGPVPRKTVPWAPAQVLSPCQGCFDGVRQQVRQGNCLSGLGLPYAELSHDKHEWGAERGWQAELLSCFWMKEESEWYPKVTTCASVGWNWEGRMWGGQTPPVCGVCIFLHLLPLLLPLFLR